MREAKGRCDHRTTNFDAWQHHPFHGHALSIEPRTQAEDAAGRHAGADATPPPAEPAVFAKGIQREFVNSACAHLASTSFWMRLFQSLFQMIGCPSGDP